MGGERTMEITLSATVKMLESLQSGVYSKQNGLNGLAAVESSELALGGGVC